MSALITVLIYIAILCIIVQLILSLAPIPAPTHQVIWAIVAIFCLLMLLDAFGGGRYLRCPHRL